MIETKYGNATLNNYGYYKISSQKQGNNNQLLHRLIWEEHYGKPIPKNCVIHHINYNKTDNRIQNLQCVPKDVHDKFHRKNDAKYGKEHHCYGKCGELHPMYGKHHSKEAKDKISNAMSGEKHPNFGKIWSIEDKIKMTKSCTNKHNSTNTTGYYRVSTVKCNSCKQGFLWRYVINLRDNNGKIYHKHISRVNLEDLEKEVKKQGFEWKKLDGDI